MSLQWWESGSDKPSPRLAVEILAMKKLFPLDQPVPHNGDRRLSWDTPFYVQTLKRTFFLKGVHHPYWEVDYKMVLAKGVRAAISSNELFRLQIVYPDGFPHAAPQAEYKLPDTSGSLHKYMGGQLCLFHSSSAREGWDPARSTAATIAIWSIQWARAWLSYKKTSRWPDASG